MDLTTINQLSATPPPARAWRFTNATRADARIRELSAQLGLPTGNRRILNLGIANARIFDLEKMVAANGPSIATLSMPPAVASDILAQHNAITNAAEKTAFYRNNKETIDDAFNSLHAKAKPAPLVTGLPLLDAYERIEDPMERAEFYRDNRKAYDAQHRRFVNSKKP